MAVLSVNKTGGGRSEIALQGDPPSPRRTFTQRYRVITDDPDDQATVIEAAAGLPLLGDALAGDPDRKVVRKSPEQDDSNRTVWTVEVVWETPAAGSGGETPGNPLDQPTRFRWTHTASEEPIYQDQNDDAIANSAEMRFADEMMRQVKDPRLIITRNEMWFNPTTAVLYTDAVNTDFIYGAAAGQAKIHSIEAEYDVAFLDGGLTQPYWRVTYTIDFREDGFKRNVLDHGVVERNDDDEPVVIKDPEGYPMGDFQLLDGMGEPLAFGATPVFLEFTIYKERAFAVLGLPALP